MKNPGEIFNFKIKWRFWAIILLLIIGGFSIYKLTESSRQDFSSSPSEISPSSDSAKNPAADCVSEERPLKVRGDSLAGLVEDGAVLKILIGYYRCHPVERDNIIIYNYPAGDPLVKIAKGISGDKFQLKKSAAGCWNILINDKILENSRNTPYCFSKQGYRMLSLYEKDYGGIIPPNTYLIFGNLIEGSLDSSRFGLIGKQDLVGKAVSE